MYETAGSRAGDFPSHRRTLPEALRRIGVIPTDWLGYDCGDPRCFGGAAHGDGQRLFDLSGKGADLYRGKDGTAETLDPTANGQPGARSARDSFSFDGGDCLRLVSASNPAFINTIHQDNAKYTLLWFGKFGTFTSTHTLMATVPGGVDGFRWHFPAVASLSLNIKNATTNALTKTADLVLAAGEYMLLGTSIDEAGGAVSFHCKNGVYMPVSAANLWDAAYSSPSANPAIAPLFIGSRANVTTPDFFLQSGSELIAAAILNGIALTIDQHLALWNLLRRRVEI